MNTQEEYNIKYEELLDEYCKIQNEIVSLTKQLGKQATEREIVQKKIVTLRIDYFQKFGEIVLGARTNNDS